MTFSSVSILSRVSLLRRVATFHTSWEMTLKRLISTRAGTGMSWDQPASLPYKSMQATMVYHTTEEH